MKNNNLYLIKRHQEIKRYFDFLFNKGYEIVNSEYSPQHFGNWRVLLKSQECSIEIYCDRNEISLAFGTVDINNNIRIGLKSMIYFLTQGQEVIGPYQGNLYWGKKKQFEIIANLLREYIDVITPYFGKDFAKYQTDLLLAQNRYAFSLLERPG